MSKAFTRESDGDDEDDLPEAADSLPRGAKNYITPEGYARLERELHQLGSVERPKIVDVVSWAAGNGDRSENGDYIYGKKKLREIDRRMRFLMKRLEIAEVVDPARQSALDKVYFGATVTYEDSKGQERTVRIVGVDEARQDEGDISWVSPVARALHKAEEGEVVKVRTPGGVEEIEVVEIRYEVLSSATKNK